MQDHVRPRVDSASSEEVADTTSNLSGSNGSSVSSNAERRNDSLPPTQPPTPANMDLKMYARISLEKRKSIERSSARRGAYTASSIQSMLQQQQQQQQHKGLQEAGNLAEDCQQEDRAHTTVDQQSEIVRPSAIAGGCGEVERTSETLLHRIHRSMAETPQDKVFARWYGAKGQVESTRTFHGIWAASGEIAHLLRVTWGYNKGDRVVLAFSFGLRFFAVFLGCLRAGIIAVPVYPPNPASLKKSLRKLELIIESCEPRMVLLCPLVNKLRLASKLKAVATGSNDWPDIPYFCPDIKEETATSTSTASATFLGWMSGGSRGSAKRKSFDDSSITAEDVAFLQFTSGSTSDPKGVMLTFGNLNHNISCMMTAADMQIAAKGGGPQDERTWFSWLPTFHDMGLIQGTLMPFVGGWTAAYCSPITFMRRPLFWLELMSKERSQMTAAPDFAYRLCVRKWKEMTTEARAALDLDLSSVVFMQNAAEPIRASTVRDFFDTFSGVGLAASAVHAAYGLAENTVACACFSPNLGGADLSTISDEHLQASGDLSYCAKFLHHAKIVDPKTCREVPRGETGELWVSSESVGAGYWGRPELSKETFYAQIDCRDEKGSPPPIWADSKFLRTGDLCRVDSDNFLYVEGRLKDLIIVAGRNIYPQDIEFAAQDSSPLVRPGCIAAFSEHELGGSLQIVLEVRKPPKKDTDAVLEALQAVRLAVMNESGLSPSVVVAVKERTIPKTTSGKIQRRLTRTLLHRGGLDVLQKLSEDCPVPSKGRSARAVVPAPMDGGDADADADAEADADALKEGVSSAVDETPATSQLSSTSPCHEEEKEPSACTPATPPRCQKRPVVALQTMDVVRIVETATGIENLGQSDDLLDLGVDSLTSVRISADLSEASGFEVPAELVFTHPTAERIAEYIYSMGTDGQQESDVGHVGKAEGAGAPGHAEYWDCAGTARSRKRANGWTTGPMRGWSFRIAQVLLLLLIVAQVFAALQPAWVYWKLIEDLPSDSLGGFGPQPWLYVDLPIFDSSRDTVRAFGLLKALAPIVWFASFTLLVILAKWVVLGVQTQCRIPLGTHAYLAWWYTNAMLVVWETIGGRWLLDTKLIIFFYRLMGAKVAWTASVKSFLRDLDSIEICDGAKVDGSLYPRRFEASYMSVMPIVVGERATVGSGSVVYGGTDVGNDCAIKPLTVIPPFSQLAPHSTWDGHPAKEMSKVSSDQGHHTELDLDPEVGAATAPTSCTFDLGLLIMELVKLFTIVCTLMVAGSMTIIPTILSESMDISDSFRYALLVNIALRIFGLGTQLALLCVLLKWILAGCVTEGPYKPSFFRTWRRWYLGRLHTLVHTYFLVFNRYRRYDWWGAVLGMDVGRGAIVLMGYNPEDAHLIKIGPQAHIASPIISVDRASSDGVSREKNTISIGSHAMIGLGSYLGSGSSVGDIAMLGGYALLRGGEQFPAGMATMCDLQSAFPLGSSDAPSPDDTESPASGSALAINITDAACTLGAWLILVLSTVASFEVCHALGSLWPHDNARSIRMLVLGTVALSGWAVATALLVFVFKTVLVGDFKEGNEGKEGAAISDPDLENGESGAPRKARKHEPITLTPCQVVRWRWMRRVLSFSLFEPFIIDPFLRGTWLLNAWLRLMGADVSMGALILGRVADYGMVKIEDGAVVGGVVYGHTVTFVDARWSLQLAPSTLGQRAVLHDHARVFSVLMDAGSTLTATSSSLSGQALQAGMVYGGRPSKKLKGTWIVRKT